LPKFESGLELASADEEGETDFAPQEIDKTSINTEITAGKRVKKDNVFGFITLNRHQQKSGFTFNN